MQKANRKKRHPLTLLEMMVAFFLLGILLTTLWGLYRSWLVTSEKNQKAQVQIHKTVFLKERLDKIALLVVSSRESDVNCLFTPKEKVEGLPTVCFSYYNQPDPIPSFNGHVCSLLYVNSLKELCVATWSAEKEERIDLLLQGVSSFSLCYFDPQTNLWREDWPEDFKHLPLWMRLIVEAEAKLELLFRLDQSFDPILYIGDA
jgi:hypothetical protein